MADRWHESRTIQSAVIGGVFVVVAAAIAVLPTILNRGNAPATFEIKTLGEEGEMTLATLAMEPTGQVIDSSAFARLSQSYIVNDSLGIAFARPEGQEWTVGPLRKLQGIDVMDIPWLAAIGEMERRGFPRDTIKTQVRYFGSRRDYPVHIRLERGTMADSVVLGFNPASNPTWAVGLIRGIFGPDVPPDSVVRWAMNIHQELDSIINVKLPVDKEVYSGVFVARVTRENFPTGFWDWAVSGDLMDQVARESRSGFRPPSMLVLNRERGFMIVNETVRLANAGVNGKGGVNVIVNRIGYAVRAGDAVYLVNLQYVSADPESILPELQRVFRSVRLRAGAVPTPNIPLPKNPKDSGRTPPE